MENKDKDYPGILMLAKQLKEDLEHIQKNTDKLEQQVLKYNAALLNIDHEMEIKSFSEEDFAMIMKKRFEMVKERRAIKSNHIMHMKFNKKVNVKHHLDQMKNAIESLESHEKESEKLIKDTGLVDLILSGEEFESILQKAKKV